ncbi:MAG: hypothetical protein A2W90_09425 [Bacteroidetes bacterium GWF2_42_66]|nr:MAG: hypothetical protein A2W92_00115 [Bacteroidetes bacterium GWA2_42_15]OFY01728.1 MAG: hypothetical protein A2W89_22630 [Bacteroidetes bacterium GWE2_42_39]OFY46475.1 MAG: hypothetical protein A2W90_09425 [Bacteroidetes bacterium GWF2_42_66]HAZ02940.1 SusC/RagA family TonB-linked outer membrane protein [Marinilabiliales bacterium]HBL76119.1 SusC/RagA family TonB-linked outer membrane protein [Prolixibacteraceae bacterium]
MKKKFNFFIQGGLDPRIKKTLMYMRLTCLIILLGGIQAFAVKTYAQTTNISVNLKNATVEAVLQSVEEQTDFYFLYSRSMVDVDRKVDLSVKEVKVTELLNTLFSGTGISWKIDGRQIVLSGSEADTVQQQKTVSGKVTDSSGAPLPGVSVVIKGTTQGIITDFDGKYSLSNVPSDATLVFSFVGMRSQEVAVAGKTSFDMKLEEETVGIEEVVAVGYGTTTKTKMASSLSTIKMDKLEDVSYSTVVHSLAGRAPGLFTRENGGEFGSLPTISIRGGGEPLYVIDNIISSKSEFAMIPPEDIEEISILKDAAATAIYGMNSANGIVLVTTKKGTANDIRFTYSGKFSFQHVTQEPEFLSLYERAIIYNQAALNDWLPETYSDEALNIIKNNLDPDKYPSYNAYDLVVRNLTPQSKQNISLNGTVNNTKIYMSLDYYNQQAIYKLGDYGETRYSFRSNVSHIFNKIGLTVNGNFTAQRGVDKYPATDTWTLWCLLRDQSPGSTIYFNPYGNYYNYQSPIARTDPGAGSRNNEDNRVNGLITLSWDVPWIKGLNLKTVGNFSLLHQFDKNWIANLKYCTQLYDWDNNPEDMGTGNLYEYTGRTWEYNLETHVNYKHTFTDRHTIELTGVYTERENRTDWFSASRRGFISDSVDELFAGSTDGETIGGSAAEKGRRGIVGRIKYDYKQKYILEGSCRYDGNDNFPKGRRWGFFPAVSAGWNMDQEPFMKPIMNIFNLSSFKVRGSIGRTGTDEGVSRFAYYPTYSLQSDVYYIGGEWVTGFREGNLTSYDLTWYNQTCKNIGIDFSFHNRKLEGTLDWFYYRTTGYIFSPQNRYTTPLGKALPEINTNSAKRRGGIEANINYKTQIGEVNVSVGGNISYYDMLWESKFDEDSVSLKNPYKRLTHQKDYYTVGLICEGFYTSLDDILDSPRRISATELKPGDLKYRDVNGDGIIDDEDKVRIGKGDFPHITYGINMDLTYKGFSLNALFQGTSNRQIYLGDRWLNSNISDIDYKIQGDYWTVNNQDALFPRITTVSGVNGGNNSVISSFWLRDAWYLRLKSLSVSYDFKKTLLRRTKSIYGLSLIFSGTNIFTISPINKYYMDPETSDKNNMGYPVSRTYTLGVNIVF